MIKAQPQRCPPVNLSRVRPAVIMPRLPKRCWQESGYPGYLGSWSPEFGSAPLAGDAACRVCRVGSRPSLPRVEGRIRAETGRSPSRAYPARRRAQEIDEAAKTPGCPAARSVLVGAVPGARRRGLLHDKVRFSSPSAGYMRRDFRADSVGPANIRASSRSRGRG